MDTYPYLGFSVKVNFNSEIGGFVFIMRVSGTFTQDAPVQFDFATRAVPTHQPIGVNFKPYTPNPQPSTLNPEP